ncbi:MAG: Fpg/Nei family DNA glycosylase [Solirubrobacterales bacterium]
MAEGDTVHRHARRLARALGGVPLVSAEAPSPRSPLRLQRAELASLAGRRLERADAHGKHLFLRFERDLTLHCHHGMSGTWDLYAPDQRWRQRRSAAWLVLSTPRMDAVEFGGTRLELRRDSELARDRRLRALGPDPLADGFAPEDGVEALRRRPHRERQLGDALLDQAVIAGIGNVYKAEGCFAARVSPWRRLADLSDTELRRVVLETASLMRAGLETGRRPRDVYGRADRPCPRCGEAIAARGQGDADRTAYWCARCQQ